MQDKHGIGGGGGGVDGGQFFASCGDRRLRPISHLNHQALKCPRCDSLNTKFCYYNNYNLSQPRHYCKNCRRYWTKGGVLRNVPVGGGCRKTKRSKPKPCSDATKEVKSNSNSSSENSSLTASTTAVTATTEVVSGSSSNSASTLINYPDSKLLIPQTANPIFDPPGINQTSDGGMFPEIGSLTSMMTSFSDPTILSFNVSDIPSYFVQQQNEGNVLDDESLKQQWREDEKVYSGMGGGFVDHHPTAEIELSGSQNRISNGGVGAVDWEARVDQGLFDSTRSVDQSYWNHNQWTDNDQHLNFLP